MTAGQIPGSHDTDLILPAVAVHAKKVGAVMRPGFQGLAKKGKDSLGTRTFERRPRARAARRSTTTREAQPGEAEPAECRTGRSRAPGAEGAPC